MARIGGPISLSEISCDEFCQMEKERQRLKATYEQKLEIYSNTYKRYVNYLFNRDENGNPLNAADAANLQAQAETMKTSLIALNGELNTIITSLNTMLTNSRENINKNIGKLSENNRSLLQDNLLLSQIGTNVAQRFEELKSKEQQIEYNKAKNKYKRKIMMFLLMGNLIVLIVLVFLFFRNSITNTSGGVVNAPVVSSGTG